MAVNEILGIDPNPKESAMVRIGLTGQVAEALMLSNDKVLAFLRNVAMPTHLIAIEDITPFAPLSYDMADTLKLIGRMLEAASEQNVLTVYRHEVKQHFCFRTGRISDKEVNDAVAHRYVDHGGQKAAVGIKKAPGPLHGISGHLWPALAVALVALDRQNNKGASES